MTCIACALGGALLVLAVLVIGVAAFSMAYDAIYGEEDEDGDDEGAGEP